MKGAIQLARLKGVRKLSAFNANLYHKLVINAIELVFCTKQGSEERKRAVAKVMALSEKEQKYRKFTAVCDRKIAKMTN